MSTAALPRRRRVVVATTAVATTLMTLAAMVALTAMSPASSQASPVRVDAASADSSLIGAGPDAAADPAAATATTTAATATGSLSDVTNVVFVLADDLDWELFRQIPRLNALQAEGLTFTNHTVTDSLCCPSRTSILRGQYIHNHGVVSNSSATGGGWPTFRNRGEHDDCLPVWLQDAGVTTALFGKYLNEYPEVPRAARYVPPGWSQWAVPTSRGDSYTGYDYTLNVNGGLRRYGKAPRAFLNDVITEQAAEFIRTAPERFFVELSTYSPHKPAPVAVRNKDTHLSTVAPRNPNYNTVGTNPPSWITKFGPIEPWKQEQMDRLWRQRAQSAESVADSVDAVRAALEESGRAANTLIVITSDNGYHAGAHGLRNGKCTAYREDTVVPMVVIGPGITPGTTFSSMTSTIDLAPTFTALLGAQAPAWTDGRPLTDVLLTGAAPQDWRTATMSESMGISRPGDPDYQREAPPAFTSLRTPEWLFVSYADGERELYDLAIDPYELDNIADTADPRLVAHLYSQLQLLRTCSGDSCRTADALVYDSAGA